MEYTYENLVLVGEILRPTIKLELDIGQGLEKQPAEEIEGWYIGASYRHSELIEVGINYSEFYPDKNNKDVEEVWAQTAVSQRLLVAGTPRVTNDFEAWMKTTTLSTRFDMNEYWTLKLEVAFNDGLGVPPSAENPEGIDQHWILYAAKMTFNF